MHYGSKVRYFFESLTVIFVILRSGRKYSHTNSYNFAMTLTPFAVYLRKMYIHLRQQLKLCGKYTFISTSMNFINAKELSITLFAYVLTFNSINGWTIAPLDNQTAQTYFQSQSPTWTATKNYSSLRRCWWRLFDGVNRSTARSIVLRYLREGRIAERPRGGANHVRVDDEMRNCLNDILNENCLLTLAQINQELRQRLPRKPTIHDRTLARTLEGMLYRVKLARPLPVERKPPWCPAKKSRLCQLVHAPCCNES